MASKKDRPIIITAPADWVAFVDLTCEDGEEEAYLHELVAIEICPRNGWVRRYLTGGGEPSTMDWFTCKGLIIDYMGPRSALPDRMRERFERCEQARERSHQMLVEEMAERRKR